MIRSTIVSLAQRRELAREAETTTIYASAEAAIKAAHDLADQSGREVVILLRVDDGIEWTVAFEPIPGWIQSGGKSPGEVRASWAR